MGKLMEYLTTYPKTVSFFDGIKHKIDVDSKDDNLATIANHKMGEGGESKPFAIVRNSDAKLTDRIINPTEMAISPDQCVYVRGLTNPPKI